MPSYRWCGPLVLKASGPTRWSAHEPRHSRSFFPPSRHCPTGPVKWQEAPSRGNAERTRAIVLWISAESGMPGGTALGRQSADSVGEKRTAT